MFPLGIFLQMIVSIWLSLALQDGIIVIGRNFKLSPNLNLNAKMSH